MVISNNSTRAKSAGFEPTFLPELAVSDGVSKLAVNAETVAPAGQSILDIVNSIPFIAGISAVEAREARAKWGNPWDHEDTQTVRRRDIQISLTNKVINARIYDPSVDGKGLQPTLVFYHGGGFVLGTIESYDKPLSNLAEQSDCIVVSVDYELAPENPFPGPISDALESYKWLVDNASEYGFDPDNMAVGGDSAGGNLAAVLCVLNRSCKEYMPVFQLLIYPCIVGNDSTASREKFAEGLFLTKASIQWFHQHYITEKDEKNWRFRVLYAPYHQGLPPAFVLTAGFDPLRDEGFAYAKKLQDCGVPARHSCYTDMFHGFFNFGVLDQSRKAVSECAQVLKIALKG